MPQPIDPPADWKNLEVHPVAAVFPPLTDEEYKTLKQDILERGQQQPILMYEGKILDGKARHRAGKELDLVPAFTEWAGDQTTLAAWLHTKGCNLIRRHLTAERRVAILRLSAQRFPEVQTTIQAIVGAAELRKQLGLKGAKKGDGYEVGEAADFMGRLVGVSGSTVKRVLRVEKEFPARLKDIAEGRATVGQVLKVAEDAGPVKPAVGGVPGKQYKLVYADLTDAKLETMPVSAWGEHKSAIALWTPPARLSEAFVLLLKWGWVYQTMLVWDKGKDTELLLVATRHHPPIALNDKVVIKDKPKDGGKSELFREILLHAFPNTQGSRLDLFTQPVPDGWGPPPPEPAGGK